MITATWWLSAWPTFAAGHFPMLSFGKKKKQKRRYGMQDSLVTAGPANGKCSKARSQQQA